MIIKEIDIKYFDIPLKRAFITSLRRVDFLRSIVVIIKTDNQLVGFGETAPTKAITGEDEKSITEAILKIREKILNLDLNDFNNTISVLHNCIDANFSAKSAIEIALYDLFSQSLNLPLYRFLGGFQKSFKTNITISLSTIKEMVQESIDALERGYNSLKIKLGEDYKEDIKRVEAIYNEVGKSVVLKLDANQGWTPQDTVKFLDILDSKEIDIELIEQPVGRYDIEGLKYIKERTKVPVLADESVFSPQDAIKVLEEDAVDLVNIKLDKCGGISKALLIADICKEYDKKCMIGCMLEGGISVGAAASVASAKCDTIISYDLDAPLLCKSTPVIGGTKFGEPFIELSSKSGLGIEKLEDY